MQSARGRQEVQPSQRLPVRARPLHMPALPCGPLPWLVLPPAPISAVTGLVIAILAESPPPPVRGASSVTGLVIATLAFSPLSGAMFFPKMNPAICGGEAGAMQATFAVVAWGTAGALRA